jgi:branched-chain amino acid transport system substrate-binding protein
VQLLALPLDADTSMKMEALTTFMKDQPDVKKVYLINQNYSHGHQVSKYAKEIMARKRPDVQFVGDDLHPLARCATSRPTSPRSRPPVPTA